MAAICLGTVIPGKDGEKDGEKNGKKDGEKDWEN